MPKWAHIEPLVEAYIRAVAVGVIEHHLDCFREFLGKGRTGIYVLRKNRDVFYVGLASSLRGRLPYHLKDRLKAKWDEFDLYVLYKKKTKYLKEVETLLIRIARPVGNKIKKPKFAHQHNLTKEFRRALIEEAVGLILPAP
jgi:hypothetical protein